jgi:restriction system protein
MSRSRSFVSTLAAMQRASAQAARARNRQQIQAIRETERFERQRERARIAGEKEQIRRFHEDQETEADAGNRDLLESINRLEAILSEALGRNHRLDFRQLKPLLKLPTFDPKSLGQAEPVPRPQDYLPKPLGFFARLLPGAKVRHQTEIRESRARFAADVIGHTEREKSREAALQTETAAHAETVRKITDAVASQHREIDELKIDYEAGKANAIRHYSELVLASQHYPEGWPESVRVAFVPESKQLVVEYDFPGFEIVPEIAAYKYIKAKKQIVTTQRSDSERRRLYSSVIAQASLRVVYVLFNADYSGRLESIVLNGHVNAIDQATGRPVHPCLVTLRTTQDTFAQLDLSQVDPETCLKGLSASVSKRPADLAPVNRCLNSIWSIRDSLKKRTSFLDWTIARI